MCVQGVNALVIHGRKLNNVYSGVDRCSRSSGIHNLLVFPKIRGAEIKKKGFRRSDHPNLVERSI